MIHFFLAVIVNLKWKQVSGTSVYTQRQYDMLNIQKLYVGLCSKMQKTKQKNRIL